MTRHVVTFFPGASVRSLAGLLVVLLGASSMVMSSTASASAGRRTAPAAAEAVPLGERVAVGAYVGGMQADPSALQGWEQRTGTRAAVASYYYGFGDVFPAAPERHFSDGGDRDVLVSWDMGPTRFAEWTSGEHDPYLDQIAAAARAHPDEVYVRPWPEMNGDWQTFQPTADGLLPHGGTYREFRQAWRYVVTYLRDHGAQNLRWVFNPTADTYAETTPVDKIWPGREYVDVLGMDGFNWGRGDGWGRWQSFRDIFADQYANLTALDPGLPVWLCEVGSKEPLAADGSPVDPDRSKARWIRAMFASTGFRRLTTVIWFDAEKERDWRVSSSSGSLRAWTAAVGR